MVVFSDLHLRESSEDICWRVLDEVERLACLHGQHVVFCGDFWHLRYQVNVRLLNQVADKLRNWGQRGIEVDFVPGNHDQVDVGGQNALQVLGAHRHVRVWTEPGIHGPYGFMPYRKDPAQVEGGLIGLAAQKPDLIFAHLPMRGALMNNGTKDQDGVQTLPAGLPPLILGHYHKRQSASALGRLYWQYVGSPYQTSFGEAGNECGVLLVGQDLAPRFHPIEVGAPRHYILEWDPARQEAPPPNPARPHDRVRLDIRASQEMIVHGKFKGVLAKHGLDQAQVNVIPVQIERDHKFTIGAGETLLQAAERFAADRMEDPAGRTLAVEALHRWAV